MAQQTSDAPIEPNHSAPTEKQVRRTKEEVMAKETKTARKKETAMEMLLERPKKKSREMASVTESDPTQ